ncbi:hypothetical protein [Halomonas nitroreducens]|uniref:Uncharacterized protein n=1 Tax=Halomonas nitroreducens TaxID=447425 RepID=A0A431UYW9_9GAMM|nr:hypothetical protein [Halomonas nitroreducens]RTQ98731.1 hypothetical protein EKG36_18765 [Halomonas nitroreducens]
MHIDAPLAPRWQQVHADWWQDNRGNDIHRVDIDDDALYHCHLAGSPLPWNAVANSLAEAMAVVDDRPNAASRFCHARESRITEPQEPSPGARSVADPGV